MDEKFIMCPHCGRKLLTRMSNGIWHFVFGKPRQGGFVPVEIYIHGSLRIKCFRRDCGKFVTLNYFPQNDLIGEPKIDVSGESEAKQPD